MGANVQIQGKIIATNPYQQAQILCDASGNLLTVAGGQLQTVPDDGASQNVIASDANGNYLGVVLFQFNGASNERPRLGNKIINIAAVAVTAGTPASLWTPTSGKKFRLLGYCVSLSVAGSVIFDDNVVGAEILRTPLLAAGTGIASGPMGNGILSAAANNILKINVTATGSVSGHVFGTEE